MGDQQVIPNYGDQHLFRSIQLSAVSLNRALMQLKFCKNKTCKYKWKVTDIAFPPVLKLLSSQFPTAAVSRFQWWMRKLAPLPVSRKRETSLHL